MKFEKGNSSAFFTGLNLVIDEYFEKKNVPRTGNGFILFKGSVFITLYLLCYSGIYIFQESWLLVMLMTTIMGFCAVSIFLNVVHDAAHGVFAQNRTLNTCARYVGEMIGLNTYIWNIRHNLQHHVFTNIIGGDLFLENMPLLRMSPQHPQRPFHRYQHFYAIFFYMFYTFFWIFVMDIKLFRMKDICNLKDLSHPRREWIILIVSKVFFISYMIILPTIFTSVPWYIMITGFIVMQMAGGLLGSTIAILPHFIEGPAFPAPEQDVIKNSWAEHELDTTVDFAPASRFWNWVSGGSNTHVAHHLYPNISQAHYYHITPLIEKYCVENGYPYIKMTFTDAVASHFKFLKKLGTA